MAHAYGDVYKIGTAGNPARRVRAFTLPTGPIRLVHTIRSTRAYWLEKQLHRCFRGKRMHGEWFRLTQKKVARFCSLAECNRPEQLPEWCSLTTSLPARGDQHKHKPLQLRLPSVLRQRLKLLAERNFTSMTAEVLAMIREGLEARGLWPPSEKEEGQ